MKRRGFLSIVGAALGTLALPDFAEPFEPILEDDDLDDFEWPTQRISLYVMPLTPDWREPVEPGKVILLRACPQRALVPDRLIMSAGGFSLLHLAATSGEPLLEHEVPSELFHPLAIGTRMPFPPVGTDTEIIVAAVNRNPHPQSLNAAIIGRSIEHVEHHSKDRSHPQEPTRITPGRARILRKGES